MLSATGRPTPTPTDQPSKTSNTYQIDYECEKNKATTPTTA